MKNRLLKIVALLPVLLFHNAGEAVAQSLSPALVIDAASGAVLIDEGATQPWYPASLTKLMSAYVTYRAVRAGNLRMDSLITVSQAATRVPPSKMGFKPGTQLTVDTALKILMVKSANDVAGALAERVAGSQAAFVASMNREAQRLGMVQTSFTNPSGLPDEAQQSSARDMALLARALLREFPEHADYYDIPAIRLGKRVMQNHNGLIGRYAGANGMKTGFICASGFNVVASARRGQRQLIAVVFGARSAAERSERAAELFERGFALEAASTHVASLMPQYAAAPPNLRDEICSPKNRQRAGEVSETGDREADAAEGSPLRDLTMSGGGAGTIGTMRTAGLLGPKIRPEPIDIFLGPVRSSGRATPSSSGQPAVARAVRVSDDERVPLPAPHRIY